MTEYYSHKSLGLQVRTLAIRTTDQIDQNHGYNPMKEPVFRSRTRGHFKLYIHLEDVNKNKEFTRTSYLVELQDCSLPILLKTRRFVCEIGLHAPWKYYLVTHLKTSGRLRFRFFCWAIEMLHKTQGTRLRDDEIGAFDIKVLSCCDWRGMWHPTSCYIEM